MRPTIPETIESELDRETERTKDNDEPVKLYEIGGYNSKAEFIRSAVREKIKRHKNAYSDEI